MRDETRRDEKKASLAANATQALLYLRRATNALVHKLNLSVLSRGRHNSARAP